MEKRSINLLCWIANFILFFILFLLMDVSIYVKNTFGAVNLTQFLFFVSQPGRNIVDPSLIYPFLLRSIAFAGGLFALVFLLNKYQWKRTFYRLSVLICVCIVPYLVVSVCLPLSSDKIVWLYFGLWFFVLLSLERITILKLFLLFLCLLPLAKITFFDATVFSYFNVKKSHLYQNEYVPVDIPLELKRPARNVILVFAESLNQEYAHFKDNKTNIKIADEEAIKFSNFMGGYAQTWTQGALFSAFTGTHIHYLGDYFRYQVFQPFSKYNLNGDSNYLGIKFDFYTPNISSLGRLLNQNGYQNIFVQGSNLNFSGTSSFLLNNGFDAANLTDVGAFPQDKSVLLEKWLWIVKDRDTFTKFKEKIVALDQRKPFFAVMSTIDLHGGKNPFYDNDEAIIKETILNLNDFIEWFKKQDFYQNTTLIIAADHRHMVKGRTEGALYNAFFNVPDDLVQNLNTNRTFNQIDLFPTILEIVGFDLPHRKAGMGTSLFSNQKTLAEKYTYEEQQKEFSRIDLFYQKLWSNELMFIPFKAGSKQQMRSEKVIAHGGGVVNKKTYLNTLESLKASARRGYQFIELDLLETKDGHIVASHDWKKLRKDFKINHILTTPTFSDIENNRIKESPLSLSEIQKADMQDGKQDLLIDEQILDFFLKHPHIYLVTDKLNNFKLLKDKFKPLQKRMIVEVFSPAKMKEGALYGFPYLAYHVVNDWTFQRAKENHYQMVTMSLETALHYSDLVADLKKQGTIIMIYTLKNSDEIAKYAHLGDVFYYDGEECLKDNGCTENN